MPWSCPCDYNHCLLGSEKMKKQKFHPTRDNVLDLLVGGQMMQREIYHVAHIFDEFNGDIYLYV